MKRFLAAGRRRSSLNMFIVLHLIKMYWTCNPKEQGKPGSESKKVGGKFRTTLNSASEFLRYFLRGAGGANSSFERLPFEDLPIYFHIIVIANPIAVNISGLIREWVLCLWRRGELPRKFLPIEVEKIFLKVNMSSHVEELKEEIQAL
jgi:hypothetical protein